MRITNSLPFISVVTINFNDVEGLSKAIRSVAAQSFRQIEFLIVDGGSTDGSKEVIADNRVVVSRWVSEKDNGIYDAMNKGVGMATGRYIFFLNSGDQFHDKEVLSDIADAIEKGNYPDILFGNVLLTKASLGRESVQSRKGCELTDLFFKPINHQSIFATRALLVEGFDTTFKILADYNWFLKSLVKKGLRIGYLDRVICRYDLSGVSAKNPSVLKSELQRVREMYFRRGFVWLLWRIKGTRFMYLLKVKAIKRLINRNILKSEIGRESVANV